MLKPEALLHAYRSGVFPMAIDQRGTLAWFSPDPRAVIPLDDQFHVPHGLCRALKRGRFTVTINLEFERVMRACSVSHGDSWISDGLIESYKALHHQGAAHSVECRLEDRLVGGLYGVSLGGAFFGESMFHTVTDASKIALVALVDRLRRHGYLLLDTQWMTPHLEQFGAHLIPRGEYLRRLANAAELSCRFQD